MKLRTKLLINFTLLFFVLINVFGLTLIKMIFYTSLENAIDSGFREYSVVYSNLKTGETMSRQFFDVQDIMTLKNKTYLHNSGSGSVNIEVTDMEQNVLFPSFSSDSRCAENFYDFSSADTANYMIADYEGSHCIYINRIITFNEEKYYLLYSSNIERIYTERNQYILLLALFNTIGGLISVFVIYYFTRTITRPLQRLIENINEIIQRNHYTTLKQSGTIKELNILTDNFNTMSHEISVTKRPQRQRRRRILP